MSTQLKSFFVGLVIGAVIAFMLGMNVGKGAPLLSNPFAHRDLASSIKQEAGHLADEAREKIHDATKPETPRK
jgi:hypothetical protein